MKNEKKYFLYLAIAGLLNFSCNLDPCSDYDFDDCFLDEPVDAFFILKISQRNDQDSVLIMFYRGTVDDGVLIDSFYSFSSEESYYLDVDQRYSGYAEYYVEDDTIHAIDGQKLRTVETSKCEETCWKIKGDELDLRLKF